MDVEGRRACTAANWDECDVGYVALFVEPTSRGRGVHVTWVAVTGTDGGGRPGCSAALAAVKPHNPQIPPPSRPPIQRALVSAQPIVFFGGVFSAHMSLQSSAVQQQFGCVEC